MYIELYTLYTRIVLIKIKTRWLVYLCETQDYALFLIFHLLSIQDVFEGILWKEIDLKFYIALYEELKYKKFLTTVIFLT